MRKSIPWLQGKLDTKAFPTCLEFSRVIERKALVVIPPAMWMSATSNGEQRVLVLILVVQGLSQKQRQLMQQYFDLVDWQGLKLPSAERRQQDSLKSFALHSETTGIWLSLGDGTCRTAGLDEPAVVEPTVLRSRPLGSGSQQRIAQPIP